jgi:glycosyltransferase involved in cell wall biosynthesis
LVSEVEAQEFNKQSKTNLASVVWAEYEPQKNELEWNNTNGLIFIGGFRHLPNLEGIQWFADKVLPLLNDLGFSAPVRVIGSGLDTLKMAELSSKGLQMLGGLDDISAIYEQSRIAIVPLLTGAGRKGKVGEALSYGIPIVSTSVGTEGFTDTINSGMIVADTPTEMAKAIYELHENLELWNSASRLGKDYCKSNLSSMAMRKDISQLISVELPGDE